MSKLKDQIKAHQEQNEKAQSGTSTLLPQNLFSYTLKRVGCNKGATYGRAVFRTSI
jgi:hypothetical protein